MRSGYRAMWLMAMFDLPVKTKKQRARANRFRKQLIEIGFTRLQLSVYGRFCASEDATKSPRSAIKRMLPPGGEVRVYAITDRQFGRAEIYACRKPIPTEEPPQLFLQF